MYDIEKMILKNRFPHRWKSKRYAGRPIIKGSDGVPSWLGRPAILAKQSSQVLP